MLFKILMSVAVLGIGFTGVGHAAEPEPIEAIKPVKITNPELVELGKKLFFDPRLSKSGWISCNSCHNLSTGGSDNLSTSVGHNWQQGPINAPTVLNSSMHLAQFWDGRAPDLRAQAGGPIANPGEMASSHELAVEVLQSIPGYVAAFKKTFGSETITIDQVTKAIAAFEETLVTPNSRFDKWLMGDKSALTTEELAGYNLFKEHGCSDCHKGPAVGGTKYEKMGLYRPYRTENQAQGRIGVTNKPSDRHKFKVPGLRNIELTYPYFHDGSVHTLREAVQIMGRLQLDTELTEKDNAQIVAFLKTLTGEQPSIVLPILPPSTDKTPRPKPFEK